MGKVSTSVGAPSRPDAVQLMWRLSRATAHRPSLCGQQIMSKLMHAVLYVFMVGMPLVGWLYLSAKGKPVPLAEPGWGLSLSVSEIIICVIGRFVVSVVQAVAATSNPTSKPTSPWTAN